MAQMEAGAQRIALGEGRRRLAAVVLGNTRRLATTLPTMNGLAVTAIDRARAGGLTQSRQEVRHAYAGNVVKV